MDESGAGVPKPKRLHFHEASAPKNFDLESLSNQQLKKRVAKKKGAKVIGFTSLRLLCVSAALMESGRVDPSLPFVGSEAALFLFCVL